MNTVCFANITQFSIQQHRAVVGSRFGISSPASFRFEQKKSVQGSMKLQCIRSPTQHCSTWGRSRQNLGHRTDGACILHRCGVCKEEAGCPWIVSWKRITNLKTVLSCVRFSVVCGAGKGWASFGFFLRAVILRRNMWRMWNDAPSPGSIRT